MGKYVQLLFITSGKRVMQAGRELCQTASTPEEQKIASAYRRIFAGTIILVVCFAVVLLCVMIFNNPFLASGDRRYGTVQQDGSIRYVQNDMKYTSVQELGLSDFELESGDRIVIFFDKDDKITAAYPKEYYDNYTESRVMLILMTTLLGITVLIIYALVICRKTPFGRPWYLYCRKLRGLDEPKLSKKQTVAVYAVSAAVSIILCAPQAMNIVDEVIRMKQIDDFGQTISEVQRASDRAQEMTDALNSLKSQTAENSGIEDAKKAAENIRDITNRLNSAEESSEEISDTEESTQEATFDTMDSLQNDT